MLALATAFMKIYMARSHLMSQQQVILVVQESAESTILRIALNIFYIFLKNNGKKWHFGGTSPVILALVKGETEP